MPVCVSVGECVCILVISLCNCNGVLKIYITAENIVETCLIEFL